jgi:hypothetical protein
MRFILVILLSFTITCVQAGDQQAAPPVSRYPGTIFSTAMEQEPILVWGRGSSNLLVVTEFCDRGSAALTYCVNEDGLLHSTSLDFG